MELEKEYIDKRTGITYTLKGDYYLPNLTIPKDTNFNDLANDAPYGWWLKIDLVDSENKTYRGELHEYWD